MERANFYCAQNAFTIPRGFRFDRPTQEAMDIRGLLEKGIALCILPFVVQDPDDAPEPNADHSCYQVVRLPYKEDDEWFDVLTGFMVHPSRVVSSIGASSDTARLIDAALDSGWEVYLFPERDEIGRSLNLVTVAYYHHESD